VRNEMGLTNLRVMVPFCRRVAEGKQVIETMAQNGLKQGDNGQRRPDRRVLTAVRRLLDRLQ
jgi:phosphoenolpyruvate synthase/pyruvate phosphate dikinase